MCDHPDYRKLYERAVEAASPILQAGGRYAHLLTLGDSILEKGPEALAAALDKALARADLEVLSRDPEAMADAFGPLKTSTLIRLHNAIAAVVKLRQRRKEQES